MEGAIVVSDENTTLHKVSTDAVPEAKQETNQKRLPKITGQLVTDFLKISSLIASISAIFHLYAFGITAKVNILAYVSLTDFLRVAIVWIAPACVIQIISFVLGSFFSVIKNTSESDHSSQTTKERCIVCKFEKRIKKALVLALITLDLAILILDFSVWFKLGERQLLDSITISLIAAWFCIVTWYISSSKRVLSNNYIQYFEYILYGPILLIISVGSGLAHGASTPRIKTSDIVSVTVGSNVHRGELLFSFEKFIVIREFDREYITLIPADKVTSLRAAFNLSSEKESPPQK